MATYYWSPSNQRDVVRLTCPGELSSKQSQEGDFVPGNMMMYMDQSAPAVSYSDIGPGNFQLQLNICEVPCMGASHSTQLSQDNLSDLIGSHIRDSPYDVWRDGMNKMSLKQPMSELTNMCSINRQIDFRSDLVCNSVIEDPQMGLSTHMEILEKEENLQGQGLSLSLSRQIPSDVPMSLLGYRTPNLGLSSSLNSYPSTWGDGTYGTASCRHDEIGQSGQWGNFQHFSPGFPRENHNVIKVETSIQYMRSNRISGLSSIIQKSKFLKVAQQLLDEVVDVQKTLNQESGKPQSFRFGLKGSNYNDEPKESCGLLSKTKMLENTEESGTNPGGEFSPASSQNLQNKITELLSMVDEVDRRYKQYYHQFRIVESYFDGIAGSGASKPYTRLALQTISRHFRCIRDAISGQVKAIRCSFGEEDTTGNINGGAISRLRFVEQKLRQHRALQQLGLMQQHAWRPQRGLPETSVTILRAWLFEHFLHPYPKESDKIMLARQTGLTRGQVSNWFINARVRLWKPMIEDMYKEEVGDSEMDSNSSSDNVTASRDIKVPEDVRGKACKNICSATTEKGHINRVNESKFSHTHLVQVSGHLSGNCFQGEGHEDIDTDYNGMKLMGGQSNMINSNLCQEILFQSDENADGTFMVPSTTYEMEELEVLGSQGGVSLTLGLQHFDGTISDPHHNFLTMQGHGVSQSITSADPNCPDTDCLRPDNQQYRFGTSHLLHDFVAQGCFRSLG